MNDNGHARSAPVRVLGIGGSMSRGSKSLVLLQTALRFAAEAGATVTLADVRALALPLYDDDLPLAAYPPSLADLLQAVRAADAYILCSPTYHGTLSGAVKNALDALNFLYHDEPPYFAGKPVALMAVGGAGAANAITSLHYAVRGLNGLTTATAVMAGSRAIADGRLDDEAVRQRLHGLVAELLDLAVRLRQPAAALTGTAA